MKQNGFKHELKFFLAPLHLSWRALIYTMVALALLLVYLIQGQRGFFITHLGPTLLPGASVADLEWWGVFYQWGAAFVLFLLLPLLLLKAWAKEKLSDLGLGLGDWKWGLKVVLPFGILLLAIPAAISASTMPDFLKEYPMSKLAASSASRFLVFELAYGLLYYVSYEVFFRGFVQMGLSRHIGDLPAILIQTAMTTLLHIGKPAGEIWSALAAGILFGLVVVRIRSVWPLVIVHWALGSFTDLFCANAASLW